MKYWPALKYRFEQERVCRILATLRTHPKTSVKLKFKEFNTTHVMDAVIETSKKLSGPLKFASGLVI